MKSILLIGINNFGTMIAKQLHDLGHQVLAVDRDEARINEIRRSDWSSDVCSSDLQTMIAETVF